MSEAQVKTEVLVAGGGPAGLVAAIAARLKGLEVTVVDCAQPPIDKACGEGIMPAGVAALRQLGVAITPAESHPFRGICFQGSGASTAADFPSGCGLGVRRTVLHRVLSQRAAGIGVSMLWNARVTCRDPKTICVHGKPAQCKWLVAADGQNSRLRRWAGLDEACRRGETRFAFRRHFRVNPWSDYVEVLWGDDSQIVITPVSPHEICVSLMTRKGRPRLVDVLSSFPYLAGRLQGSLPASPERGSLSVNLSVPAVTCGNIALAGDASGSIDAIAGEGLCFAFQQASCLAEAMSQNDLACYQADHHRITGFSTVTTKLMVAMGKHSAVRQRVLHGFSSEPQIFAHLLALHVGAIAPADFGMRGAFALGWRVLTAR